MENFNVTLASTLLDIAEDHDRQAAKPDRHTGKTGIKNLDRDLPPSLWCTGKVIGIASIDENKKNLAIEIIATHLLVLDTRDVSSKEPSVYILAPPSSSTISAIYETIQSRLSTREPTARTISRYVNSTDTGKGTTHAINKKSTDLHENALSKLNDISILQYMDLIGLSESISEISRTVTTRPGRPGRVLIYIEGLTATLSSVVSRIGLSGSRRGVAWSRYAALLSGIMRNVRLLCRPGVSVLVGVDAWFVAGKDKGRSGVLRTGFADEKGRAACLCVSSSYSGGAVRENGVGYAEDVFVRILEGALDTVVLVHGHQRGNHEEQMRLVEVVKDVTGSSNGGTTGYWALWR